MIRDIAHAHTPIQADRSDLLAGVGELIPRTDPLSARANSCCGCDQEQSGAIGSQGRREDIHRSCIKASAHIKHMDHDIVLQQLCPPPPA